MKVSKPAAIISLFGLAAVVIGLVLAARPSAINSYANCVRAGNPVQTSYPSVCRAPDGRSFVNPDEHVQAP